MKKSIYFILTLFIVFSSQGKSQDLKLDDILTKYFNTIGVDKMTKWQTVTTTGKASLQGTEYPFRIIMKRPGKIRIEVEIQSMKMIQAFDGQHGWSLVPWTGSTDPQDMTADETKVIKDQADFEGSLYNWSEKGHKAEYIGKEDVEGSLAYHIKVSKANGDIENYFIDVEDYVVLKVTSTIKIQGNETESENLNSNYKTVDGVLLPFIIENKSKGQTVSHFMVDKYETNTEVNDSLFIKPVKK
jgi:outer membrane lipoprotein-sorting protein